MPLAGQLDTTFGTNGTVTTGFGFASVIANGLAIQSDGKMVAVGSYLQFVPTMVTTVRLLGSIDGARNLETPKDYCFALFWAIFSFSLLSASCAFLA